MLNELALELNSLLKELDEIKEYNRLAHFISNDLALKNVEIELKELQKKMVDLLDKKEYETYETVKKSYLLKKEKYDLHPLVYNYQVLKHEVNDLFQLICKNIQENL